MSKLDEYLRSYDFLPDELKDFHDQKDFFKSMHYLVQDNEGVESIPNWVNGHIYIIDFFLFFMAARGYKLQKIRKKGIEFREWPNYRKLFKD